MARQACMGTWEPSHEARLAFHATKALLSPCLAAGAGAISRPAPVPALVPCSHMIRAGTLHTIQQRLAAEPVPDAGTSSGAGGSNRTAAGPKHVPLLLRAKEPAVEERLLKLAAARAGAGGAAAAEASEAQREQQHGPLVAVGSAAAARESMQK